MAYLSAAVSSRIHGNAQHSTAVAAQEKYHAYHDTVTIDLPVRTPGTINLLAPASNAGDINELVCQVMSCACLAEVDLGCMTLNQREAGTSAVSTTLSWHHNGMLLQP